MREAENFLRCSMRARAGTLVSAMRSRLLAGVIAASVASGCASAPPTRITLASSFPQDAVSVCFVRQPDNDELACTATPVSIGRDGSFVFDGEERQVVSVSPTREIAVVRVAVDDSDVEFRVRAVAYNDAGPSLLSRDYFVVDPNRRARSVRVVRVEGDPFGGDGPLR